MHHSGSGWLARPSPWGTFTSYSLPAFLAHSASGHFRGNDDVRDECGVPPIATELVHGRERRRKRQAAAAFLVVPVFKYKLAREKQSVQQRGREFIVVRAAGAMLTFGAKLRRARVIRRVL